MTAPKDPAAKIMGAVLVFYGRREQPATNSAAHHRAQRIYLAGNGVARLTLFSFRAAAAVAAAAATVPRVFRKQCPGRRSFSACSARRRYERARFSYCARSIGSRSLLARAFSSAALTRYSSPADMPAYVKRHTNAGKPHLVVMVPRQSPPSAIVCRAPDRAQVISRNERSPAVRRASTHVILAAVGQIGRRGAG
jgi:hypothetical protein